MAGPAQHDGGSSGSGPTDATGPTEDVAPVVDGRRERWVAHRARRRDALVAAAVEAVDHAGATTPTFDDVAAAAQVSRTVLYRYFSDLDDLQRAVATSLADDLLDRVLAPLADGRTARDIIVTVLEGISSWVEQHPRRYLFLRQHAVGAEGGTLEPGGEFARIEDTVAERLAALLTMFMTAFGMADHLAELGARSLIGLVESSVQWWARRPDGERIPRHELVAELTTSVWAVIDAQLGGAGVHLTLDDPLPEESP